MATTLKINDKVKHPKYGRGTVVKCATLPTAVLVRFNSMDKGTAKVISLSALKKIK